MNLTQVDQIAKAVLYEGYMLYPYRPSSVKNRQRFNFGVLYPQAYSDSQAGADACSMRVQCLVCGSAATTLAVRLRFLQLQTRREQAPDSALPEGWQEVEERELELPALELGDLCAQPMRHDFNFPAQAISGNEGEEIRGAIEVTAEIAAQNIYRVTVLVRNSTGASIPDSDRDRALMHSLVSTHLVLGVQGGEFVSLLEPPEELRGLAEQCQNAGAWPVLIGDPGDRDTMLASPIILYDYPQIAPESAGDLFDGTEIDEILSLRIMTLTEQEKQEIRQSDDRARQVLERTENLPAEQFMKLHGALRGLRPLGKETP
jgi:hypothetical protein